MITTVKQKQELGESLSTAVNTITSQACSNQQRLEQRLDRIQAAVEQDENRTKNGHQMQREATTQKQKEAAAQYNTLCEKFGHCLEQPPTKLREYIKAISDLKKRIAQDGP